MVLDLETVNELKRIFDERYVQQADCTKEQESVNRKFANDDKRIDMMAQKIRLFEKLAYIIATASVGSFVTQLATLLMNNGG